MLVRGATLAACILFLAAAAPCHADPALPASHGRSPASGDPCSPIIIGNNPDPPYVIHLDENCLPGWIHPPAAAVQAGPEDRALCGPVHWSPPNMPQVDEGCIRSLIRGQNSDGGSDPCEPIVIGNPDPPYVVGIDENCLDDLLHHP